MKQRKGLLVQVLISLLLPLLWQPALAAESAIEDHPGYVDFSMLSALADAEPSVEVSLKTPLLNLITNLIRNEDEMAAEFISKLARVNVQVYPSDKIDVDEAALSMTSLASNLDSSGWERVVRIREDDEHVDIYFRLSDDANTIFGIAIMVAEATDTVLVNIVGDINVNDIEALGRRFEIAELIDLDTNGGADGNNDENDDENNND